MFKIHNVNYCKTTISVKLVNISVTSVNYLFVVMGGTRIFKSKSPSNLHVYNTLLLTVVTVLYIRFTGNIYFVTVICTL